MQATEIPSLRTALLSLLALFCLLLIHGHLLAQDELQLLPPVDGPAHDLPLGTADNPEVVQAEAEGWRWYAPTTWYNREVWDGSLQLGINGGAGNTESFSLKTGGEVKRETERADFGFDASYARTTANSVTTQDLAIFDSNLDWKFGDSPWSLFNKGNVTFDKLRAFDMRLVFNSGLGYKLIRTQAAKLNARFGSGASREFGGVNDTWVPEAVFGADWELKLAKRHKFTTTVDYFPDWGDFASYRIVGKAAWEIVLDRADRLSLKLEATDRYDSTPDGLKPNDINYAMLLLWKL